MKKFKTHIIEKIDNLIPEKKEFSKIKKGLTYTWVMPRKIHLKPWFHASCGLAALVVILLCLSTYFGQGMVSTPEVTEKVEEMHLVSWDENVYCLGENIYIDYPMLTTKCNIESKILFSDTYWEVYQDGKQIDKSNIPLSFGVNTFTICEKSIGDDLPLYNLNILVGSNIENLDINFTDDFDKIEVGSLQEQVRKIGSFKEFETFVLDNNLNINLLMEYDEIFFRKQDLLLIVSKNNLTELSYQQMETELNVTLVGEESLSLVGYLIPVDDEINVETYNVELFNLNLE